MPTATNAIQCPHCGSIEVLCPESAAGYLDREPTCPNCGADRRATRAASPVELDAAIRAEVERIRAERNRTAEAEPCIHCGAPIDPVDGTGHDPGCSYETPAERAYNASTEPAPMECPSCGYIGAMRSRLI